MHLTPYRGFKMQELGLNEATHKRCTPAQCVVTLGIKFDSVAMAIAIPEETLREVMAIVRCWNLEFGFSSYLSKLWLIRD